MGFYETLAELPAKLAQARMQMAPPQGETSGLAESLTAPAPLGMGADPVYGGLFSMLPQLAQQQGAGAPMPSGSIRSGPENLMTRGDVTGIAPALRTLLDAKRTLGLPVLGQVASDYRTREEQARLYQMYLNGTGNLAARPGTSLHEEGKAFDINSSFLREHPELVRYLTANGFARDVGGEPWHFSWQG